MRFKDKICVVTGAAGGIGSAVMKQLFLEGGKVVGIDLTAPYSDYGNIYQRNLVSANSVNSLLVVISTLKGNFDVIINCAGTMDESIAIDNFTMTYNMCHYGMRYMEKGAIVNVTSIHSLRTTQGNEMYAASKAAIEAYSRGIATDDIRVNCVAPGAVDTPMLRNNPKFTEDWKYSQSEDIAEVICFLASDQARAINGATIISDRGVISKL